MEKKSPEIESELSSVFQDVDPAISVLKMLMMSLIWLIYSYPELSLSSLIRYSPLLELNFLSPNSQCCFIKKVCIVLFEM